MVDEQGGKSALSSKTIHFNWISGVLVPAIWPFLPKDFRNNDYAIHAVTAWFTIGNIILRILTKNAIHFLTRRSKDGQTTS